MRDDIEDFEVLRRSALDPAAFGLLYERHSSAVHRYLSRRVGASVADDLLADVFVAALTSRTRVRRHPSGSALPWLYGIAGNVVRAHLRKRPAHGNGDDSFVVDWDAIDARVDASALGGRLRAVLQSLNDSDRELLLLIAWEHLTPADAGAALGLTPTAARSRLHRARARAQAALNDTHDPDPDKVLR